MVRQAADSIRPAAVLGAEANMAKLLAADASWAAADMCVQTFGGFGFAKNTTLNASSAKRGFIRWQPISTNMILSYLAEHVLGLPRSY
ncbi:MAG: acyl-CoA dehydrogenase family protein [Parvularculaceae bacterium]